MTVAILNNVPETIVRLADNYSTQHTTMKKYLFFSVFIAFVLISCSNDIVYTEYRTLPLSGWDADSVLIFEVPITDTVNSYDIIVDIRHSTVYPYQNMWLFVNTDTIDFYLANQRGEWLGNGSGELREMPVLYKSDIRFDSAGTYNFSIIQAMRDKSLKGVRDVGLIVKRHKH